MLPPPQNADPPKLVHPALSWSASAPVCFWANGGGFFRARNLPPRNSRGMAKLKFGEPQFFCMSSWGSPKSTVASSVSLKSPAIGFKSPISTEAVAQQIRCHHGVALKLFGVFETCRRFTWGRCPMNQW